MLALTANKLSEQAHAAIHEGDTYFAENGANLSAWKIWYGLDNDQDRFVWAIKYDAIKLLYSDGMSYIYRRYKDADKDDKIAWALVKESENNAFGSVYLDDININDIVLTEQNVSSGDTIEFDGELIEIVEKIVRGKGVIYRMVDEWGNDCPYDFKNILFRKNFDQGGLSRVEVGRTEYVYTFAWVADKMDDASIVANNGTILLNDEGEVTGCHHNVIGDFNTYDYFRANPTTPTLFLPGNVFLYTREMTDACYNGCCGNHLADCCAENGFSGIAINNVLQGYCQDNMFRSNIHFFVFPGVSNRDFEEYEEGKVVYKN